MMAFLHGVPFDGARYAVIGVWVFLLATIVVGSVGDLLRSSILLNIAAMMAMVFLTIVGVFALAIVCIVLVCAFFWGWRQ